MIDFKVRRMKGQKGPRIVDDDVVLKILRQRELAPKQLKDGQMYVKIPQGSQAGDFIDIPTPKGVVQINVPPHARPGQLLIVDVWELIRLIRMGKTSRRSKPAQA
jgi:hypothetical protein